MTGMEASIISHPRTWKASGHIANFNDDEYFNKIEQFKINLEKSMPIE